MTAFTNDRAQRQTNRAVPVFLLRVGGPSKQEPARCDLVGDNAAAEHLGFAPRCLVLCAPALLRTPPGFGTVALVLLAFVRFTGSAALLIVLPGPDNVLVIRNCLRYGRLVGAYTAAGSLTGVAVWIVAAAFGLSTLLGASRVGYDLLRIAGAAYLLWLGVGSLRSRGRMSADARPSADRSSASDSRTGFLTGVASNLANPKTGVFFIALFPAFIPRGNPVAGTSLLFGATFLVEATGWFAALLWLVSRTVKWVDTPRVMRRLERASGVLLIGFAIRLISQKR